tara:strand:- start:868 stop:1956 length:1089 start_codon:yes stop_codon:yes gene_type:complete
MFGNIFYNKNIIVTGHTGFKGSWLTAWLLLLGANVIGVSLKPKTLSHFNLLNIKKNLKKNYYIDIRDYNKFEKIIINEKPDFVFHLAAQAIVKTSYDSPKITWETNVIGTLNVLESLRKIKKNCIAILITSDKCYYNKELFRGYKETDELGGKDPYSASKASAEYLIHSYVESFFKSNKNHIQIASVRAGNVIGGGDWSENRIVPDCIKSWLKGKKVNILNPKSTRPWQHVLEPLGGYLYLAKKMYLEKGLHGESFNFGPNPKQNKNVIELVSELSLFFESSKWSSVKSNNKIKESNLLKLNCNKAKKILGWQPVLSFSQTVKYTSTWYDLFKKKHDINYVTHNQIHEYYECAINKGKFWIK